LRQARIGPKTLARSNTLIVSPTPLDRAARERFPEVEPGPILWVDLLTLRSNGLIPALRILRSYQSRSVIVTGDAAELYLLRDVLIMLSFIVPGAVRWLAAPGRSRIPIRWWHLPMASSRLFLGVIGGVSALLTTLAREAWISRTRCKPVRIPAVLRRCLYLRPGLAFGVPVGGSVGHVAGVANSLHRRGLKIRLLASKEQPLLDPGITQVMVNPSSLAVYPHELNRFRYHLRYLKAAGRQVADWQPDFIYQRYGLNDFTGIYLRARTGIPLIMEFNGSETWAQTHWGSPLLFHRLSERIEVANLKLADLVVVVSEEIRMQVQALGVTPERVLFYPNGVDPSMFDPSHFDGGCIRRVRAELGVPGDSDLFTFVGTFGRWHGTDVLAAAIRELIDQDRAFLVGHRIHFLLVGEGVHGAKVRATLGDGLGAPFVTLCGYRAQGDTPRILAASDVCLSPHVPNPDGTPFFGSPTKLFEYMAMAKVIVASDLDQIGWVLRGWRPGVLPPLDVDRARAAGILVEPGDRHSLIEGIRKAAGTGQSDRVRLGEAAREIVLRSFTWDMNVAAVFSALENVLRRGKVNKPGDS
jgi:glycosyltransferase involved in cell wall biosynthesis